MFVSQRDLKINTSFGAIACWFGISKSQAENLWEQEIFGRRELRNVFLGAAENVMRLDGELRDQYDALRAKGTDHKDAKISLARKIASIALCLLKNNDKYNENYSDYLKERKKLRKEFLNKIYS